MVGEETLLNQTVNRLEPDFKPENIYIVTTEDLAAEARRLLPQLPSGNVLTEPEGRNTAPCLALALVTIERAHPEGVMVVLSADHYIGERAAFLQDIETAVQHAATQHELVTFGIRPTHPETGYGYIETSGSGPVLKVQAFREKPPYAKAVEYLTAGNYFWNAGMFIWTLRDMRAEMLRHCPEVLAPLDTWSKAGGDRAQLLDIYRSLPKVSIDYALMEKSSKVAVVPARFPWSDVGSWPAVVEFRKPDEAGNVQEGNTILLDSRNCAVFGGKRLIAASGIEDLIVVDEEDALLICRRDKAQDVKLIVERLEKLGRKDLL